MRKPDLFIVGAPKAGTTSLQAYLNSHPAIFMAPHEPTFWGSDLDFRRDLRRCPQTVSEYLGLFSSADEEVLGEKSVFYLMSTEAAAQINEFNPNARVIVMLRNPVDAAYSLHGQFLKSGNEEIRSFEDALAVERERSEGQRIPSTAYFAQGLQYTSVFQYARSLRRYLDVLGPKRVHIILYEELKSDTGGTYRNVLRFLGVDPSFSPDFRVHLRGVRVRSLFLQRLMKRPPRWLGMVPKPVRDTIGWRLRAFNEVPGAREPLSPETRKRLGSRFKDDLEALSDLLGRDFSNWILI